MFTGRRLASPRRHSELEQRQAESGAPESKMSIDSLRAVGAEAGMDDSYWTSFPKAPSKSPMGDLARLEALVRRSEGGAPCPAEADGADAAVRAERAAEECQRCVDIVESQSRAVAAAHRAAALAVQEVTLSSPALGSLLAQAATVAASSSEAIHRAVESAHRYAYSAKRAIGVGFRR